MCRTAFWPPWLDARRLDDDLLAQAYERTDAPRRACVKNGMALLHALWGEYPDAARQECRDAAKGFRHVRSQCPASWALFVLTPGYAAPVRLAAALMPALLAHVPLVGALCAGGNPSTPACVTLELAGIEHIFQTPLTDVPRLLRHMAETAGQGRIVLLHQGELDPVRRTAEELRLPVWEERRVPLLWIDAAAGHAAELLAWAHPDAAFIPLPATSPQPADRPDALFADREFASREMEEIPLTIHPGLEGCWLHPDLTPEFFRQHRIRMAPSGGDA